MFMCLSRIVLFSLMATRLNKYYYYSRQTAGKRVWTVRPNRFWGTRPPQWGLAAKLQYEIVRTNWTTFAGCRQFFVCPIAIAYSMGQIIKSVCVCVCICLSVYEHSHGRISWSIFTKIGTDVKTPKKSERVRSGSISHHPFPYCVPKNPHFRPRGP